MNDGTENIMDLEQQNSNFPTTELETVTIRFAGDSGDGMQLTGNQFTQSSVMIGNDVITFPDYPADAEQIKNEGVVEPLFGEIEENLARVGLDGEVEIWRLATRPFPGS